MVTKVVTANGGGATATVARRRDDGERDYGDGAAAVASAMVWESEGERQESD